jgi:putative ABC transport system permease protein
MALGASGGRVVRMLLLQGMRPVWFGLLLGIAGALGLTRLVATLLYGVTATDPLTFGSTLSVLALVAALASYVPARRAARVDPAVALRHE